MDNITANPISTISTRKEIFQDIEDNVIDMTKTISDYEENIQLLKGELAK